MASAMTAATMQVSTAAVIVDRQIGNSENIESASEQCPAQPRPVQVDVDHVQVQPAAVWQGLVLRAE